MDFFDVAIAKKLGGSGSGGGSDLPKVTSEDNNKVLTVVEGQWDKANKDWVITETPTTIYDNEVVVEGEAGQPYYQVTLEIDSLLNSETAHITFNGIEYDCECTELAAYGMIYYMYGGTFNIETGEVDFSTYPFTFICSEIQPATVIGLLFVPQLGTYSLEIEGVIETITVSDDFEIAVDSLIPKIVPTPSEDDNEKILMAYNEAYYLTNIDNIIPSIPDIPDPSSGSNGQVIGITNGSYNLLTLPTIPNIPIPTSSNNGKFLGVNNGSYSFMDIPSEVPTPTANDYQKFLRVDSNGSYYLSTVYVIQNISDGLSGSIRMNGCTTLSGSSKSVALGSGTTTTEKNAVALGNSTKAYGVSSIALGERSAAQATCTFACGRRTVANGRSQVVLGEDNVAETFTGQENRGQYIVIIGNGTFTVPSNAATLDWSGNQWLAGSITLGNTTLTESDLQALLALLT